MTIHKWALFEKTSSLILLKIAQMMLIGPLKMSHKSGLGPPSKKFHDGKIEIFRPSQSSTGIKGAADPMLPWKTPNDPKTLPTGILHDYMSYWATLGPFGYPRGAQKGPFGLKQTLTGRKASERSRGARFGPNCCQLVWLGWNYGYHTLWPGIWPFLGPQWP